MAFFTLLLGACKVYKQDIMFNLEEGFIPSSIQVAADAAEKNYRLLPNDYLKVEVFTNKGEAAIDPNQEFGNQQNQNSQQSRDRILYLVQHDGTVKFPIIGRMTVSGLTVDEVERKLEENYNQYYKESFVKLTVTNRRVIVLGAEGGMVVPLSSENTSLIEVIALYGGVNLGSKAGNIRVIRGDLNNPKVFLVDLSSVDGMRNSMISIESGDIIYIEPWRRPWLESIKDVAPVFNIVTSVIALVVLITSIN